MQRPFSDLRFYTAAEVAAILKLNHQVLSRKLLAGEIPAYKIGKDWRIEEKELMSWLKASWNRPTGQSTDYEEVIERNFFEGGRLKQIPARRSKRSVVLNVIARSFSPGRTYAESEVNDILTGFHPDFCTLRRELIINGFLKRDAGRYWRPSGDGKEAGESVAKPSGSGQDAPDAGPDPPERT
jgi:excisionase family DNA binding protein